MEYRELLDEELVVKAQAGDEAAEEALIRKYKDVIRTKAHLYFMVGADSEDVVQEGMIGLFKAIRSYEQDKAASFRTYADICINRQILSAVKHATRLKYSPLNTSIPLYSDDFNDSSDMSIAEILASGIENDPEAILIMKEKMSFIEKEGRSFFSEMENKVLSEFLQGKNYTEIGQIMGKSPKSIDNAIQRIRKKLEAHLSGI
ncbi:RNA polymerase sporulation sigma factor SigH [Clostridium aminobutyricum]|uniref:RNA polymerase sporulation sigma factor SigH n=1 Tax=Clostridium aminobutyricum TaxID=33953 RepID=UPI001FD6A241|nr:RNA polymerase sporulation sigma factor SigH [Clostridium aminobutyricum]